MKNVLILLLFVLAGCQDAWDSTTAGRRQQAMRSQRLVSEKFETLYAEAEKSGDTELCTKILIAYTEYLSRTQDGSDQQRLQHQQTMNQLRQMEHSASFDRMRKGGLP